MSDLSLSLPPALRSWIEQRVAEGRHTDAGDYIRDLVRRDQEQFEEDAAWVRAMVEEGLASGVIDAEPEDVIEEIIAERHARRG